MNLENKLHEVRLKPVDLGSEHDYSLVLEAMREVHDKKQPNLLTYEQTLREEFADKYNSVIVNKMALIRSARRVLERIHGRVRFNPQDEGIYVIENNAFSFYFQNKNYVAGYFEHNDGA